MEGPLLPNTCLCVCETLFMVSAVAIVIEYERVCFEHMYCMYEFVYVYLSILAYAWVLFYEIKFEYVSIQYWIMCESESVCRDTCLGITGTRAGKWLGDDCFEMPFCHCAGGVAYKWHVFECRGQGVWWEIFIGVCMYVREGTCVSQTSHVPMIVFVYHKFMPNLFLQLMYVGQPISPFFPPRKYMFPSLFFYTLFYKEDQNQFSSTRDIILFYFTHSSSWSEPAAYVYTTCH